MTVAEPAPQVRGDGPRITHSSRGALLLTILLTAVWGLTAYSSTFVELDLGWVLDNGEDSLSIGIQRTNTETFVEPGHPMVMHSWAANVLFALAHRATGGLGLAVAHAALIALVSASCATACFVRSRSALPALAAALFGMLLVPYAFLFLRAQLFSCVFLPMVVAIVRARRLGGYLWLIPTFALWANLHGGFALGVVLALGGLGIEGLRSLRSRGGAIPIGIALLVGSAILAATLLNPWGISVYQQATSSAIGGHTDLLTEWYPAWHPAVVRAAGSQYLVLSLVAAFLLWRMRRSAEAVFVVVAIIALAFLAVRHARLAPLAIAPLLAEALVPIGQRISARLGKLVLGGFALLGVGALGMRAGELTRIRTAAGIEPVTVLAALAKVPGGTRVWNDFDIGGALVWACPGCRVAIDGRAIAAYSPQHLVDMLVPVDEALVRRIEASGVPLVITMERELVSGLRGYRLVGCDGYCLLARVDSDVPLVDLPTVPLTLSELFAEPSRPFSAPR